MTANSPVPHLFYSQCSVVSIEVCCAMSELPSKPWEINRAQNNDGIGPLHSTVSIPTNDPTVDSTRKATPPLVPSRSNQRIPMPMSYQPSYGGYGSFGTGYGQPGYGSMYGGIGSGYYGSYNRPYGTTGGFTSQAEESTRNAFQSVESIVRAFTSVSTMLESTLGAVYSSFRAVLDVADQFSRVRATFSDILSSITIFRFIRFLYRRIKSMLNIGGNCDEAWDNVNADNHAISRPKKAKSWPMLLFMSVVLGGPYLIWKLLSGGNQQKTPTTWASGQSDHVVAKVEYSFEAENDDEITVKAGDMLNLAPKEQQPQIRDWVLASLDGETTGMVPANHVKILGIRRGTQTAKNRPTSPSTPTAQPANFNNPVNSTQALNS